MWVIAGVLLGLVVLASVVGFHSGPHTHLVAGVIGLVAAVVLVILASTGSSTTLLWVLLVCDVTLSVGVGYLAWRGLSGWDRVAPEHRERIRTGTEGTAVSDLDPNGIVRVEGEEWSAVAVNAPVRRGSPVQVVGRSGVRLDVWGEESLRVLGDDGARDSGKEA
jgi:membrane-bound ClpP family serine protease